MFEALNGLRDVHAGDEAGQAPVTPVLLILSESRSMQCLRR